MRWALLTRVRPWACISFVFLMRHWQLQIYRYRYMLNACRAKLTPQRASRSPSLAQWVEGVNHKQWHDQTTLIHTALYTGPCTCHIAGQIILHVTLHRQTACTICSLSFKNKTNKHTKKQIQTTLSAVCRHSVTLCKWIWPVIWHAIYKQTRPGRLCTYGYMDTGPLLTPLLETTVL